VVAGAAVLGAAVLGATVAVGEVVAAGAAVVPHPLMIPAMLSNTMMIAAGYSFAVPFARRSLNTLPASLP
jgi:hypothetical protein